MRPFPRNLATSAAMASAAALMLALLSGAPAYAAVSLAAGTTYTTSANTTFTINTAGPYWSVVAVRPPAGADYDLWLSRNGSQIATSVLGTGEVDFIAIDTNRIPLSAYSVAVTQFSGTGQYTVDFSDPRLTLPASGASGHVSLANGEFVVVRDVYLTAGQQYLVQDGLAPYLYLMGSDPADQSTWTRSRTQAVAHTPDANGNNCARYRAVRTGWYGAVSLDWFPDHAGNGTQKFTVTAIAAGDPTWDRCQQF